MSSSSSDSTPPGSPLSNQVATQPLPAAQLQLVNIKSHIPIVLDLQATNYGQWSRSFNVLFGKFGLSDHVDGSTARGDSDWVQTDFAIVSWFYGTVSSEILQIVQTDEDTAYSLWRDIKNLFHDKKEARSVYVSAEFRSLYQGDMPVLAYCTKMKTLADALRDLGAPVRERDLILNILRGLNPRLHSIIPTLTMHPPLPSFLKVRSSLLLEELRLAQAERVAQHAAYNLQ